MRERESEQGLAVGMGHSVLWDAILGEPGDVVVLVDVGVSVSWKGCESFMSVFVLTHALEF